MIALQFAYFAAVALQVQNGWLYMGDDGDWAAWNTVAMQEWGAPIDPIVFNPLVGLGSTFFPNAPWLNPGALVLGYIADPTTSYVASYLVYGLALFLSVVFLARCLGVGLVASTVAAQLHLLFFFPPFAGSWFFGIPNYFADPLTAWVVTLFNVLLGLALCVSFTRLSTTKLLAVTLGLAMLLISLIVSAPITLVSYVPFYGGAYLAVLIARREQLQPRNVATLVATPLALLAVIGYIPYIRALTATSPRLLYSEQVGGGGFDLGVYLAEIARTCDLPTFSLICPSSSAAPFIFGSLALAVVLVAFGPSMWRWLGGWYVVFYATVHLTHSPLDLIYSGLPPIRSEFLVWSTYSLATILCVAGSIRLLRALPLKTRLTTTPLAGLVFGSLIAVGSLWPILPAHVTFIWPLQAATPVSRSDALGTSEGAIIRFLERDIALEPGAKLRGYATTVVMDPQDAFTSTAASAFPKASWVTLDKSRQYFKLAFGSKMQEAALWWRGIPTFDEYGQWITTQLFGFSLEAFTPKPYVVSALLGPGNAEIQAIAHTSFLRVYERNDSLLAALGVRFVISDTPPEGDQSSIVLTEVGVNGEILYLQELENANLGQYAPTRFIAVANWSKAWGAILANDSREDVAIVTEPILNGYTSIETASIFVEKGGYLVTAKTLGKSMLLLPVQYSNCLVATDRVTGSPLNLHRLNIVQAGLEFEGEVQVQIENKFGLFGDHRCRMQDAQDIKDMEAAM